MTGRGLHGRRLAQLILLATIALDLMLALVVLFPPNFMGVGMTGGSPVPRGIPLGAIILALGAVFHVIGLAWMVRIVRADPEGGRSNWRAFRRH